MDKNKLILHRHPTQVRIILASQIQIASAIFPNEGVFCQGGWIDNESYRLLSDAEAEFLIQANPFQRVLRLTEEHMRLKFQKLKEE